MAELNRSEAESSEFAPTLPIIDSVPRVNGPMRKSTVGGWSLEEDDALRKAVHCYKAKKWKKIAELVSAVLKKTRTNVQCQNRWHKVLNPNLVKGSWTPEEDALLSELVKEKNHGKAQWSKISKQLTGRNGKQCRERWHNHLKPTIIKTSWTWTKEEEIILVQAQREHGNKWAEISKLFPGRTENNIKNHWNCSLKKKLDQFPINLPSAEETLGPMNRTDTPPSTSSFRVETELSRLNEWEKRFIETLRMRARTFEKPSIFIREQKVDSNITSSGSTPLERRLDFDSV